jgi:hypothetical protein
MPGSAASGRSGSGLDRAASRDLSKLRRSAELVLFDDQRLRDWDCTRCRAVLTVYLQFEDRKDIRWMDVFEFDLFSRVHSNRVTHGGRPKCEIKTGLKTLRPQLHEIAVGIAKKDDILAFDPYMDAVAQAYLPP